MPATISVGVWVLVTTAAFHPHVVVCGARRTPGPHVEPTGSDASIADHTLSAAALSYWAAHPTCRSQFASNSARDCVLKTTPSAGALAGASPLPSRPYAGASSTRRCTFCGFRAAYPPERGPPSDQATRL